MKQFVQFYKKDFLSVLVYFILPQIIHTSLN